MGREEIILDKDGIRRDLMAWNIKEVVNLAGTYDKAFQILLDLLHDKNPMVRTNALQVIKELLKANSLNPERISLVVDDLVELARDKNERVSLKALEVLNLLLETGGISEEDYDKITDALVEIIKRGAPILSEYASEGLGKAGAKVVRIAKKLIGWLFSLIRSSEDRQVQSAAITALTEMAYRTEDSKVFNEIFDKMVDLVDHVDPYIQERALLSIDRMLSRPEMLTKRNKIKAVKKISKIKNSVRLASKASLLLEKLEKVSGEEEETLTPEEVKKKLEISEYGPEDVEKLLDAGKTDIVAELAKIDPIVMSMIIDMLNSDDPTRRMDALWVLSKTASQLTPTDAYSVLPVLGEFLKSRNPWARSTAAETLAEIYSLYPGTAQFFTSLLDVLLKSNREPDIEGALELIQALQKRMPTPEFQMAIVNILEGLLRRKESRATTLRFMAREAQSLIDLDYETLVRLENVLKEIYGEEGGKYDNIIASLIDLIDDLIRMKGGETESD
ncbi:hypothetical protein A3L09_10440 [Thermococcus profundus]|uniref:Condensin complex subunit 1 C-terminal domain-containing protein n=2 Tax=Thermococcus profundus TaxID=49899 RepID=A0A2Z2MCQ9_THEPR|nr:hypothetical protein A3L09_10440 [Thermococcus profundus]